MQKIALCVIVKPDDNEALVLHRLLDTESLHKKFDGIFITITSKEGDPNAERVKLEAEQAKAHISYFKWINDFAAARNFNYSQVPEEYNWIMWLDADDIVKGSKHIVNAIKKVNDNVDGIILPYLYDFDEYGECTVKHNKIRITRNDGTFKWIGELHEDLIANREINTPFSKDIQILHLTNHKRVDIAIKRNLNITKRVLDRDEKDPRHWWNHANAAYMAGKATEAVETFFEFIQRSSSEEEVYLAWLRISDIYHKQNDYERAIESGLEALRLRPWYPDAYYHLAQSYFNTRNFKHTKEMLLMGLTKNPPENQTIVWNPRDYDYNPLMLLAKTYYQLNQPHEAYKILAGHTDKKGNTIKGLIELFPKYENIIKYAKEIKKICDELDNVDKICEKIKKCKTKKKIQKIFDKIPLEMKSHPKLVYLRNIHFTKTESSGRDLDIYCFETAEKWNPEIAKTQGMGGSEEAVLNITPILADLGWNVTIYNTCGHKAKQFGKVLWKPHWEFNYRDKRDVFVSWRHPMVFSHNVNSPKNYVWLHDTIYQNEFTKKRLDKITKILPLSQWHKKLYPGIENDKFMVSANGIDVEQFNNIECPNCNTKEDAVQIPIISKGTVQTQLYKCDKCGVEGPEQMFANIKRDPNKLIYTSAQDRGLETLLKLFPKIKRQIPEATLDIYYGWQTWDSVYAEDLAQQEWKKKVLEMQKQDGVKDHGRVTHEEIAKAYLRSSIWAYPTTFTEISCITAMKAQAAGCIPVTTTVAALDETVQYGIKLDFKDIYTNPRAQKKWVDAVVFLLKNQWKQQEIREEMIPWAKDKFSWKKIAQQWNQEFLKK